MKRVLRERIEFARHAMLRNASSRFAGWSEWCLRQSKVHMPFMPTAGTKRRLRSTYAPWEVVLRQAGRQDAARALLHGGALGHDLRRQVVAPEGKRVLVLAAHHDDETIGAGGTLLRMGPQAEAMQCVYYTDGANISGKLSPQETRIARQHEAAKVWKRLGGQAPIFLDIPNRQDHIDPDAAARLSKIIHKFKPDTLFLPLFFEQPVEHRRLNQLLRMAYAVRPPKKPITVWGYQITCRVPGNVVVDITNIAKKKYKLNRLWRSQNCKTNYAYLAQGRDIANGYLLKGGGTAKSTGPHAEAFLSLPITQYLELVRLFFDLPESMDYAGEPWNAQAPTPPPQEESQNNIAINDPWTNPPAATQTKPPDFLVIGMQKSGSYWLTALLNAHPDIRCFPSRPGGTDGTGETHLFDLLARMRHAYASGRKSIARKQHGYFADQLPETPPTTPPQWDQLHALLRDRFNAFCQSQRALFDKTLVGEKTTESVHHPDLIDTLYPGVRKVCILRDPRDRVVSFFHHQKRKGRFDDDARIDRAFVDRYLERVEKDYAGLLKISQPLHVLTYEALTEDPITQTRGLLAFLEANDEHDIAAAMVQAASFKSLSGRDPGDARQGSHFRRGEAGQWSGELDADLAERMVDRLAPLTQQVAQLAGLDLAHYS